MGGQTFRAWKRAGKDAEGSCWRLCASREIVQVDYVGEPPKGREDDWDLLGWVSECVTARRWVSECVTARRLSESASRLETI